MPVELTEPNQESANSPLSFVRKYTVLYAGIIQAISNSEFVDAEKFQKLTISPTVQRDAKDQPILILTTEKDRIFVKKKPPVEDDAGERGEALIIFKELQPDSQSYYNVGIIRGQRGQILDQQDILREFDECIEEYS